MAQAVIVVGIDCGLSGAVATYDTLALRADVVDMPTFSLSRNGKNKREINATSLAAYLNFNGLVAQVFVEQVGAMPRQGVTSQFSLGKSFGIVVGILAARALPVTFVSAQRWKKNLGVPASKDGARARASQLMPASAHQWPLVKHDGRAEAALIAYYGALAIARMAA